MLKRMVEPKTLHEYITNERKRMKTENISEIEERIRNHKLLAVVDPQSVLDKVREE